GLGCLRTYRTMIDAQGVEAVMAVATSAVREAANREHFVELARTECGVDVQVISGEEEARLIYLGARGRIDWGGRRALIVDIGGGSVEFIVGDPHKTDLCASLKLGVRRLSEEFLGDDPPVRAQLKALRARIEGTLGDFTDHLRTYDFDFVVGTSGTLKNLAEIIIRAEGRSQGHIHGEWADLRALKKLGRQLAGMTMAKRAKVEGLDAKRTDTIVAGAQLMKYILRAVGHDRYQVCDYALRDGLVVEYIDRHGDVLRKARLEPDIRRRSVMKLFRRFNQSGAHPKQVARLALSLFDQLQPLHKLDPADRELLEYAALLHDIGYTISARKHHKHSQYMIQHGELYGFSAEEHQMIGMVARYHRGSGPRERHEPYRFLQPSDRQRVVRMTSLLRLANALDRSHTNTIADVQATLNQGDAGLTLHLATRSDPSLELWALQRNATLFTELFGLDIATTHAQAQYRDTPWIL
ncbi:MAG: Ppx/GppA phosphatase family protein, partial [Myxococcota bacterium]